MTTILDPIEREVQRRLAIELARRAKPRRYVSINLRVPVDEIEDYRRAARRARLSMQEFIRVACRKEVA
jgi:hypothetical protein